MPHKDVVGSRVDAGVFTEYSVGIVGSNAAAEETGGRREGNCIVSSPLWIRRQCDERTQEGETKVTQVSSTTCCTHFILRWR
jgi:hypothetical protein